MMRLDQMPLHRPGVVTRLATGSDIVRRLMAMGFFPGVSVTVTKRAPLGDPIALKLHGYELSLRRCDAATIHVTLQPEADHVPGHA